MPNINAQYIIQPAYKIQKISETDKSNLLEQTYSVMTGIKIFKGDEMVYKQGLQQEVTVTTPKEYEKQVVDFELSRKVYNLLGELSKNIQLSNN